MAGQERLKQADFYSKKINDNKDSFIKHQKELDDYYRIEFTYTSNAIEGNTLNIEETKQILQYKSRMEEKLEKDCNEAIGLAEAFDYMLTVARNNELVAITEDIIKRMHYLLCYRQGSKEAGQYRNTQVHIEEIGYIPPSFEEIPHLMGHFISQMEYSKRLMHPIEFAAMCHKRIIDIHPFMEGNGQIARLFMNLILIKEGYGVVIVPTELRSEYQDALVASQGIYNPDIDKLINLVADRVIESELQSLRILKIK